HITKVWPLRRVVLARSGWKSPGQAPRAVRWFGATAPLRSARSRPRNRETFWRAALVDILLSEHAKRSRSLSTQDAPSVTVLGGTDLADARRVARYYATGPTPPIGS